MSILSYLFSWLPNPVTTAQSLATTTYQTGEAAVCASAVTKAIDAERLQQQKCDWWSKNGVLVGAGAVLGVLVVREMMKKKE